MKWKFWKKDDAELKKQTEVKAKGTKPPKPPKKLGRIGNHSVAMGNIGKGVTAGLGVVLGSQLIGTLGKQIFFANHVLRGVCTDIAYIFSPAAAINNLAVGFPTLAAAGAPLFASALPVAFTSLFALAGLGAIAYAIRDRVRPEYKQIGKETKLIKKIMKKLKKNKKFTLTQQQERLLNNVIERSRNTKTFNDKAMNTINTKVNKFLNKLCKKNGYNKEELTALFDTISANHGVNDYSVLPQLISNKRPSLNLERTPEPETKEPETKEPEIKEPETKEPETKEPETKEPETKEPETKEPETKEPETKEPETKEPETKEPETKEPETKEPETKDAPHDDELQKMIRKTPVQSGQLFKGNTLRENIVLYHIYSEEAEKIKDEYNFKKAPKKVLNEYDNLMKLRGAAFRYAKKQALQTYEKDPKICAELIREGKKLMDDSGDEHRYHKTKADMEKSKNIYGDFLALVKEAAAKDKLKAKALEEKAKTKDDPTQKGR